MSESCSTFDGNNFAKVGEFLSGRNYFFSFFKKRNARASFGVLLK
jgi:hypothetical protein